MSTVLNAVGLSLRESGASDGFYEFVVEGDTYRNRELIKRHGGRWSGSRRGWYFRFSPEGAPPGLADAPAKFEGEKKHYHGHRERLRSRFLEIGPDSLADYELLELLLFFTVWRRDTKPLAKAMLQRFGSLGAVLARAPDHLNEFEELRVSTDFAEHLRYMQSPLYERDRDADPSAHPERYKEAVAFEATDTCRRQHGAWRDARMTMALLRAIQTTLQRVARESFAERPVISSWTALIDYLNTALAHEPTEQFRILFLDRKNILIKDEMQQRGTVDHTPLYPREVVKRALELGASALIMVHNHPSGDPTPSRPDIEMTKQVVAALEPVGITLHDHVIVGKGKHTSFRSQRLI